MSNMKTIASLLLIVAICIPAAWILAAGDDEPAPGNVRPRQAAAANQRLASTLKLTFTIVSEDDEGGEEEDSLFVLCAGGAFRITHDASEPDFEHDLEINGQLQSAGANDRVLIRFEAGAAHTEPDEDAEAIFSAEGSAIVPLNKEVTLTNLGGDALIVTATLAD